jgi:threonyl-tRNA synthetase
MGEAMELCYGGCLCYGPPIEQGFYYDMYLENRYRSCQAICSMFIRIFVTTYDTFVERYPVSIMIR